MTCVETGAEVVPQSRYMRAIEIFLKIFIAAFGLTIGAFVGFIAAILLRLIDIDC